MLWNQPSPLANNIIPVDADASAPNQINKNWVGKPNAIQCQIKYKGGLIKLVTRIISNDKREPILTEI